MTKPEYNYPPKKTLTRPAPLIVTCLVFLLMFALPSKDISHNQPSAIAQCSPTRETAPLPPPLEPANDLQDKATARPTIVNWFARPRDEVFGGESDTAGAGATCADVGVSAFNSHDNGHRRICKRLRDRCHAIKQRIAHRRDARRYRREHFPLFPRLRQRLQRH